MTIQFLVRRFEQVHYAAEPGKERKAALRKALEVLTVKRNQAIDPVILTQLREHISLLKEDKRLQKLERLIHSHFLKIDPARYQADESYWPHFKECALKLGLTKTSELDSLNIYVSSLYKHLDPVQILLLFKKIRVLHLKHLRNLFKLAASSENKVLFALLEGKQQFFSSNILTISARLENLEPEKRTLFIEAFKQTIVTEPFQPDLELFFDCIDTLSIDACKRIFSSPSPELSLGSWIVLCKLPEESIITIKAWMDSYEIFRERPICEELLTVVQKHPEGALLKKLKLLLSHFPPPSSFSFTMLLAHLIDQDISYPLFKTIDKNLRKRLQNVSLTINQQATCIGRLAPLSDPALKTAFLYLRLLKSTFDPIKRVIASSYLVRKPSDLSIQILNGLIEARFNTLTMRDFYFLSLLSEHTLKKMVKTDNPFIKNPFLLKFLLPKCTIPDPFEDLKSRERLHRALSKQLQNAKLPPLIKLSLAFWVTVNTTQLELQKDDPLIDTAYATLAVLVGGCPWKNSEKIFSEILEARKESCAFSPPVFTLNGSTAAFNLTVLQERSQGLKIDKSALSPEITKAAWDHLIANLKKKVEAFPELKNEVAMITGFSWNYLYTVAFDDRDFFNSVYAIENNPVPISAALWNAILKSRLQLSKRAVRNAFSERELALLKLAASLCACPDGKLESLPQLYHQLESKFKFSRTLILGDRQEMQGEEWLQNEMESFFNRFCNGDNQIMQHLIGYRQVEQGAHQAIYLKNRISHLIGLSHDPHQDPNTHLVYDELIEKTQEELLEVFFSYATPQALIAHLMQAATQPLGNKNLKGWVAASRLGVGFPDEDFEFDGQDNIVGVKEKFFFDLLIKKGILTLV